eukprot:6589011-Pyramimonas_sp.AAC.1
MAEERQLPRAFPRRPRTGACRHSLRDVPILVIFAKKRLHSSPAASWLPSGASAVPVWMTPSCA